MTLRLTARWLAVAGLATACLACPAQPGGGLAPELNKGSSVTSGVEAGITTGSTALDLLLDSRMSPGQPANTATPSIKGALGTGAAAPLPSAADPNAALRDAMLQGVETQARQEVQSDEDALRRRQQHLAAQSRAVADGAISRPKASQEVVDEAGTSGLRALLLVAREHRYWIMGIALFVLIVGWALSNHAMLTRGRRPDAPRQPSVRKRR